MYQNIIQKLFNQLYQIRYIKGIEQAEIYQTRGLIAEKGAYVLIDHVNLPKIGPKGANTRILITFSDDLLLLL